MSNFFMTLSNASKFPVVQYHRKTPTVESFLVKLSAWDSNFSNRRTLSQLFFREFYKIFITIFLKDDLWENASKKAHVVP